MEIKSDIQIAQEAHLENIKDVAAKVGVTEDELEMYGKYKAKLSDELIHRVENNEDGKLVLITAINPTPAGEGKTTISLGLTEALNQKGISAIAALREPSLGPCFGIKEELPAADTHRLFLWKILICILLVISTR